MSFHKAPSAGMKVTPSNPPITHESTGKVENSSLAAESIRSGGPFKENPESRFESTAVKPSSSSTETSGLSSSSSGISSAAKPHGKNLKEGGFEGSGTEGGSLPEPGSKDDPGRKGLEKEIGKGGGIKISGEGENMFCGLSTEESA
ncbi:hypothetical protein QBC38DRAFT_472349 [Podospora fimiseda]|uniref:Uncharacterized protein n=1 Tax=Podospora fimiseda TaxID=252190 RepID=A0AAN7BTZ0_9PEZI|nr:hypothetical protein QBC38DRAFT_472349 [Podospora fimiseda]